MASKVPNWVVEREDAVLVQLFFRFLITVQIEKVE